MSHSSTESEVVALDTAVRVEGILAFSLFDFVLDCVSPDQSQNERYMQKQSSIGRRKNMSVWKVDYVDPMDLPVARRGKLIIFEDSDAVIKTVLKGRSMAFRHITRTQRVALDWLLERIREDGSMCFLFACLK